MDDYEVWSSGDLIHSAETYDDAIEWLHGLWKAQGDDAIIGLTLEKHGSNGVRVVVRDYVLQFVLNDMPA